MAESYCYDFPRPAVTVDIALFRRDGDQWRILLIRRGKDPFAGTYALPGGFVDEMEPLEHAARRELREETSIELDRLHQLRAYGDPGRDPRGHTVSIAHCAVIERSVEVASGDDADDAKWFRTDRLPELAFDHDQIIQDAIDWLDSAQEGDECHK